MSAEQDRAALEAALASIVDASIALQRVNQAAVPPGVAVDLARIYAGGLRLETLVTTLLRDQAPLDQLLARPGVRHEINTPLNHIIGYSELLLEEGAAAAAVQTELESIRAAAQAMLGIVNPASAAGAAPASAPADAAPPAAPMEPGVVLLVDDDPEQRELMRRHVSQLGHETLAAEHGGRALELLQKRRPDVILLDIQMPVMDGFATLAALKNHQVWREIPVIMLSALEDTARTIRCIQMGAEDYLHKPCNAILLNARIAGALTRRRLREQELGYANAVAEVATAAAAMALGIYQPSMLDAVAARPDGVGHLARVFQSMAREIQARHDALLADRARVTG